MSNVVGSLLIKLSAHTADFFSGLTKSATKANDFSRSVIDSFQRLDTIANRIFAGLAGYGLEELIRRQFETAKEALHLADRLSTTTDEITRLQFAAKQTGMDVEGFNLALERMLRNVAMAREGQGKQASGALTSLGLDPQKIGRMVPTAALGEVAEAFKKLEDPIKRAQIEIALFGKAGFQMGNLLMLGKEGLAQMAAESDRLGNTLREQDAVAMETTVKAMERLNMSFGGVAKRIGVELAPTLTILADLLTDKVVGATNDSAASFSTMAMAQLKAAQVGQFLYECAMEIYLLYLKIDKLNTEWTPTIFATDEEKKQQTEHLEWLKKQIADTERATLGSANTDWDVVLKKKWVAFAAAVKEESEKARTATSDFLDPLSEQATKLAENWSAAIDNFGATSRQKQIAALELKGLGEEVIGQLKAMDQALSELEAGAKGEKLIEQWQEAIAAGGKEPPRQRQISLLESLGVDPETLKTLTDLDKQLTAIDETARRMKLGEKIIGKLDPLVKFAEQLQEILDAIGVTEQQRAAAIAKLRDETLKNMGDKSPVASQQNVGLERYSREAALMNDKIISQEMGQKTQLAAQLDGNKKLDEIVANTKAKQVPKVAPVPP
jgi:hypothetical protein